LHDEKLNDILVNTRLRHGIVSIPRGSSAVAGYKALKRGDVLGMLIDQDIDVDGVMVPFFGVPAHTPRGAALFAMRSGAAIVPMAIHMQPGGKHRMTILPELGLPPATLDEEQSIELLTERCSEAVERLIRIYPQQWVWFHDRWRKSRQVS
jgi:KDO2-lipid IV(A) lauroyltransferase